MSEASCGNCHFGTCNPVTATCECQPGWQNHGDIPCIERKRVHKVFLHAYIFTAICSNCTAGKTCVFPDICMDIGCLNDSCAVTYTTGLPTFQNGCTLCGAEQFYANPGGEKLFGFFDPLPSQSYLKGVTLVLTGSLCLGESHNGTARISLTGETIHTIDAEDDEFCGCGLCRLQIVTDQQGHSVGNYWTNYNYGGENAVQINWTTFPETGVFFSAPSLIFLHYDRNPSFND